MLVCFFGGLWILLSAFSVGLLSVFPLLSLADEGPLTPSSVTQYCLKPACAVDKMLTPFTEDRYHSR